MRAPKVRNKGEFEGHAASSNDHDKPQQTPGDNEATDRNCHIPTEATQL